MQTADLMLERILSPAGTDIGHCACENAVGWWHIAIGLGAVAHSEAAEYRTWLRPQSGSLNAVDSASIEVECAITEAKIKRLSGQTKQPLRRAVPLKCCILSEEPPA